MPAVVSAQSLGLNFGADDPSAEASALLPEEVAGVVPAANWNNLETKSGSVSGLSYDMGGTAVASTASVDWSVPNTWRSGDNNAFPEGPDKKLMQGYADSNNTSEGGVSIQVTGLDAAFTSVAYDVYVYFVSDSAADRGGAYTINDGNVELMKYGSTMASPSAYVEDPGTDIDNSIDGTYLVFSGLTGASFTLTSDTTLTTPNGFRAPANAVQIVAVPEPSMAAFLLVGIGVYAIGRRRS